MKKKIVYFMILTQMLNFCCDPLVSHFAFFPNKEDIDTPLPKNFEDRYIQTVDNIKIHSIFVPSKNSSKLVIYFHGNAGNIYHRLETLSMLNSLGINVLGISYRGYGRSEGKASEKGIYKDAKSALQYAKETLGFDQKNIFLLGRSIGSAPACYTAMNNEIAGAILVTPLYSGKEMAKIAGLGLIAPLARKAFDNSDKLKEINCPIIIIHGTADETVPFWMGKKLHEENPKKTTFVEIKNGNHNELEFLNPQLYWNSIKSFIEEN